MKITPLPLEICYIGTSYQCSLTNYNVIAVIKHIDMQRKVAWINPEDSKSGKAIGVALNDTSCQILRNQIGNHHKWVFVHKEAANRNDGTMTPEIRKMRVDNNRSWNSALKRAGIEDLRFHDLRHTGGQLACSSWSFVINQ